ncbi:hypothetical protein ZIOFF_040925 [Zingiber officinale]|uniref:Uncharacterized protein n=1 Tax=Zingiber officinale TaxID=94328 RepID=A0A8J5GGF8_ZINOF|nr:hypothetical protein ZIOFF_040925 [Zingiber officinale]
MVHEVFDPIPHRRVRSLDSPSIRDPPAEFSASMASKVAVSGELPVLPPIKTAAPIREKLPVVGGQASPGDGSGDEEGCVTPKSEEHYLKPLAVCPPAPRKPKPVRRTSPAPATDSKWRGGEGSKCGGDAARPLDRPQEVALGGAQAARPWDLPLADEGRIQAWITGKQVHDSGFLIHRVVVSLFLRCLQTSVEVICAFCCVVDDHQLLLSMETSCYAFLDPSHVKVHLIFPCPFHILLKYCCDSPIFKHGGRSHPLILK